MKMKKLLASALAAAMVVSSMVGTIVTSAATTVGTITAGTVNATVGETDTVAVPVEIAFTEGVVAPHNIVTVALDGYKLDSITGVAVEKTGEGTVEIDADGSNLATGKILFEAPVDSKAPTVTKINFVANFVDADETDTVAGTYAITVNGDDMTDVNEREIGITAVAGSLVVAEAHVCDMQTKYDENGHWTECTCGEKTDVVPHTFGEAAEAEDGKWYKSCECGYSVEVDAPVVDFSQYITDITVTYDVNSQATTGKTAYTKPQTKELAAAINAIGGQITRLGMKVTVDGSDPTTSTTSFDAGNNLTAANWNTMVASGLQYSKTGSYKGMNLDQIANTNVQFAAYAEYKVDDETFYVFGKVTGAVLMDYLKTQTDEKSSAIVEAYDLLSAATSTKVESSSASMGAEYGPTFTAYYDLKTIKSTGKIAYSKAQTKALAAYVNGLGGKINRMGMKVTVDGSDPTTSTTSFDAGTNLTASNWNTMLASGLAYSKEGSYTGMNISQFGYELKFAAYYEYTDANGDAQIGFVGETQTIKFIDQIVDDASVLAVSYKELYTMFVG